MTKGQERDLIKLLANGKELATEYPDIYKAINEPKYSIGDIGLNARILNYWEKKGLLLSDHDPRKRKKFDLVESIWMKMIQKFRQFDISLDAINKTKEILIIKAEINELNKETIEQTILALTHESQRDMVLLYMQSNEFAQSVKNFELNMLQVIAMDVLLMRNQYSFLIDTEGQVVPFKINEIEYLMEQEGWRKLFYNSHITISVNEIIAELVGELGEEESLIMGILSEGEVQVLNAMKEDGVKSVEINICQDGSQKAEKIILTKQEVIDDSKRLSELMLRNKYEDIIVKTENGRVVYCERKEKRKII
ncbi:MAG: MerR family transcriptional regulator [Crocinitomicaceae bacterium]